jgi:hypothetical protein
MDINSEPVSTDNSSLVSLLGTASGNNSVNNSGFRKDEAVDPGDPNGSYKMNHRLSTYKNGVTFLFGIHSNIRLEVSKI